MKTDDIDDSAMRDYENLNCMFVFQVFGRSIQTNVARNRWFDMPFTREESLQADKKLVLTFGPSQDPEGVTMVDSVKV
jgi:E3 ubiquitin-protein ligase UBR4